MTDEIKKESEINVAKEDTAIAPAVESVLQDTVEWVASTKTPAGNGQEYEEVGKSDIPEPAQARLLEPEIKYAYFVYTVSMGSTSIRSPAKLALDSLKRSFSGFLPCKRIFQKN